MSILVRWKKPLKQWKELMDTKDIKNIKAEDLIGIDDYLEDKLSRLDHSNYEHRQIAIDAMELYIRKYISPAMYLPETTLDSVVGKEIGGLGLDFLFNSNRKDLSRPEDKEIDDVLEGLAKRTPTPRLRNDFWAAWLLENAVFCIKSLYYFLNEPLRPRKNKNIPAKVLQHEIVQLKEILKLPMTAISDTIEFLVENEQEALAEWNEERSISS